MAQIIPTFELMSLGSVTFSGFESWIDLASYGPEANSPIPSGKQIWVGYVTCISYSKSVTFEIRPNLPTKSAGTTADTQLRGLVSLQEEESADLDLYYGGAILSLAPTSAVSTGVEKLWLRVRAASSSSSNVDFILYYTLY